jgi:hypothetical protein
MMFETATRYYSPRGKQRQTLWLQMESESEASKARAVLNYSKVYSVQVSSRRPPLPSPTYDKSVPKAGIPKDMTTFGIRESLQPIGPLRELRRANDKTAATEIAITRFVHSEAVDKLMESQLQELAGLTFARARPERVGISFPNDSTIKKTRQTTIMKRNRKVTKSKVETYVSSLQETAEAMVLKAARGMALESSTPMIPKAATAIGLKAVAAKLLATTMARLLG